MNALKKSIFISIFITIWMLAPKTLLAALDSAGTEFYFAFQPNNTLSTTYNRSLSLFITGKQDTQGTITIPGLNFTQSFVVQANKVTTVVIPASAQFLGSNAITKLGVHVVAEKEVTIYGTNWADGFSVDSFLALPVGALGLEYIAMSAKGVWYSNKPQLDFPSEIAIVGAFDNTTVTITPSVETRGHAVGIPFTIFLNSGDTYQILGTNDNDLTGTVISSTAPVAVMSGANSARAYITTMWSHIVEMMPPVKTWGKSFFTVPFAAHQAGDIVRILASQDNTLVRINGVSVTTLSRGKFYETTLIARSHIETSAPALVAQYTKGADYGSKVGPAMMLITPTEQFSTQSTFSTVSGFSLNLINVVAPTTAISSLRLDNAPIDATLFAQIGSSDFSGAQIPVSAGTHVASGNIPFGIYVYGFFNKIGIYDYASYAYPGGMSFQPINQMGDSFAPNMRLLQVGDTIQGVATDSEDINCNVVLDAGEDLNNNDIIDRRSNAMNNGVLDQDTGVFKVELETGASNLKLDVLPFVPGALTAYFSISLLDPKLPGSGALRVTDGVGNVTRSPVSLSCVPVLKDVRVIDTISSNNIDIDSSSFSKTPHSVTVSGDRTVIEWRFDAFSADAVQDIGLDLVVKNPLSGEHRLVSHKLELYYIDPNGKQVNTELDSQYLNVLNSAFDGTISPDKPSYGANENVQLSARINNFSEYARTVDAKILIEDGHGILVKEVALLPNLTLSPGAIKDLTGIPFNTGSIIAGDYIAHLYIYENNRQVEDGIASFKIQPTTILSAKTVTDNTSYQANEQVVITSTIANQGGDIFGANLNIRTTVIDSQGIVLFSDNSTMAEPGPGQTNTITRYWNTAAYPAGTYSVGCSVSKGTDTQATATTTITILGSAQTAVGLKGTITAAVNPIDQGKDELLSYSIVNSGNEDLRRVTLNVAVIDPETEQVVLSTDKTISLPKETSASDTVSVPTASLTYRTYLTLLQVNSSSTSQPKTIASTIFTVRDPIPPTLTVSTLADGSYTNQEILNIAGTASDNSGTVNVTINGSAVPLAADGSFSHALPLLSGPNTITVVAADQSDNKTTDSRTINLDTTAPKLIITSPADNFKTTVGLLEVSGTVDETATVTVKLEDNSQTAAMNGTSFTAPVNLPYGWNTIEITARDLAGNPSSQKRTVIFDDQVPSLEIFEPPQDIRTNKSSLTVGGKTGDLYSEVGITVTMDGTVMTPPVINGLFSQVVAFSEEKLYQILITASNEVGTQTTALRNVIFDKTPPVLTIDPVTSPTNAPTQTMTGTREEGTLVTVSCPTATVGTVEYPAATTWQAAVSNMQPGENRLRAETKDSAENISSAAATILYVPQAPDITVTATPNIIWPPNKKLVAVKIDGNIVTHGSDIKEATVSVADEYGKYNLQGVKFGDTVWLEAWREGNDLDGRVYTITARVVDQVGNTVTRTATVTVPHDMGK